MASPTYITLPDGLFEVSGSSRFSGALDLAELVAGPDVLRFDAPPEWDVLVTNAGGRSFVVSGSVAGVATTDCARCLEPFAFDIAGEVEGFLFAEDPGEDLPDETSEDEYAVLDDRHGADIGTFLTAALVLAAPLVPLHDEDCAGLCPHCGKNLNEGPCDCAPEPDGDFERAANPFAALKDYRFGN